MSKNKYYRKFIHNRRWGEVRKLKLQMNPICEICKKEMAEEIHHIKPVERYTNNLSLMEDMFYRLDNLQSLCHKCHSNIHKQMRLYHNQKESIKRNNKERTDDFFNTYFN